MAIEVTNHAFERYCERVLSMSDVDIKTSLNQAMKDEQRPVIVDLYNSAKLIYRGRYNDNAVANYYLVDDLLFVTNTPDQAIMTLYYVEFGFAKGTNKKIIADLVDEIDALRRQKAEKEPFVAEVVAGLDTRIQGTSVQIDSLKTQLRLLEDTMQSLEAQKNAAPNEITAIDQNIHTTASKICYSMNYKLDSLKKR